MSRTHLPLNALRAFEVSARHLSFTKAGQELFVTQAAVSHHVKSLEDRLGAKLFRRLPGGLALTDEGLLLLPVLRDAFARIGEVMERFEAGQVSEVLTVGAVGTFAVGWLLPRLDRFRDRHPFIDLRLLTNNNKVDLAGEGLDFAIRFGDGAWHGTQADELFAAPLAPLCTPRLAAGLREPADLRHLTLLRSYRSDEWPGWFAAAGVEAPPIQGPIFDSSQIMVQAALQHAGVALAPPLMFGQELLEERLVQPFATTLRTGSYWLTRLKSKPLSDAMQAFRGWLLAECAG
ncbi:LysR family transcriptional regulator [Azospirillum thermophilum]|uniref:LysR family transcriptional regulator n=1 Tax=Azospirillum thermophilum TaxID=2202148 RepID=A0A2S2CS11_9PROT|nr:LysR family transcriptional regulator [Azospirillum thermophilum]AWK87301.1 LysR family transcriptional regulator [Azospirillum thermophilum]